MTAPIVAVDVMSIYTLNDQRVPLPKRMAHATPDMKMSIHQLVNTLPSRGGKFILSDLYRSYDMQLQAHLDWLTKKKKAFSPEPGSSMHEAGRAFDVDLASLRMSLAEFWMLAAGVGIVPIIAQPDKSISECWHFECRGSHQLVFDYYLAGKGTNFKKPYAAMAASAIAATGVKVDMFEGRMLGAQIQSGLIRLGHTIGNLDGSPGPKTHAALASLQLGALPPEAQIAALETLLQQKFPGEFFDGTPQAPLLR
ncbi:hypothetical protein BH11PSE7_BH11PSE7_21990 [soil metagenome]